MNGIIYKKVKDVVNIQGLICENCGKSWGYHTGVSCALPQPQEVLSNENITKAKTQKVRGITWCIRNVSLPGFVATWTHIHVLLNTALRNICTQLHASTEEFTHVTEKLAAPIFARPCPLKPRHGFVESRDITSARDLQNVAEETLAADADGELLLCEKIDADYSAVATVANITYGLGNDGATAGRNALTVPYPAWASASLISKSFDKIPYGVIKDSPYIELVWPKISDIPYVCQLRDGPIPQTMVDYIPKTVEVAHVLNTTNCNGDELDLITFEEAIAAAKDEVGFVVNHVGGCLTSHYAIHCIINNVPILCSRAPVIGETLRVACVDDKLAIDYDRLAVHIVRAFSLVKELYNKEARNYSYLAAIGCSYLHAQILWDGRDHLLKLRAYGIAATLTCLCAALLGEARHASNTWLTRIWGEKIDFLYRDYVKRERSVIFSSAFSISVQELAAYYPLLYDTYLQYEWPNSYGGLAWLNCTQSTQSFFRAVCNFVQAPCSVSYADAVKHWNRAINTIHNSGTPIRKMDNGDDGILTSALTVPARAFLAKLTPSLLFDKRFAVEKSACITVEEYKQLAVLSALRVTTTPGVFTKTAYVDIHIDDPQVAYFHVYIIPDGVAPDSKFNFHEVSHGVGNYRLVNTIIRENLCNGNSGCNTYIQGAKATLKYTVTPDHQFTASILFSIGDYTNHTELITSNALQRYLLDLIGILTMSPSEEEAFYYSVRKHYSNVVLPYSIGLDNEEEA